MAKSNPRQGKQKNEESSLPGLSWILTEDEPEPPAPSSGEVPRKRQGPPTKVKMRSGAMKESDHAFEGDGLPPFEMEPKRNRFSRAIRNGFKGLRSRLNLVIPDDPVEKMRFKLQWLAVIKFPITFLIIAAICIMITIYVWFITLDYQFTYPIYSHDVPVIVFGVPGCTGLFLLLYLGVNLSIINRFERKWTSALDNMLHEAEGAKDADSPPVTEGPTVEKNEKVPTNAKGSET